MKTYSLKDVINCPSLERFLILSITNSFFYELNRGLFSIYSRFSNVIHQPEQN